MTETPTPPPLTQLPRVLHRWHAVAIVIGSIIGSGIFLKAGQVAKGLNSFGLVISVWIFVGIITLCGSLSLAELAAMMPHAGGPYVYLRAAFGRMIAFLWGWTEFWIIRTGSLGALSCATAIYLDSVVPIGAQGQQACAISIVVGLTLVNAAGVRWAAHVQGATVLLKVAFLLVLIGGPVLLFRADAANLQPVWPAATNPSLWTALGAAMIAVLWPYDGWINIGPVAEEIKEPQRNVPLALMLGIGAVMLLYVGAVTSYHLTLPMERVAGSTAIAADVCEVLFGPTGRALAAIGVMFSTFGACNSNLLCGPRIYFAVARDGLLPGALGRISDQYQTPANAILLQGFWSVVLIMTVFGWQSFAITDGATPMSAFDALTDFVIFGASVFYALAVGAVFVLRRTRPDLPRPYRTWGYPFTPALYLAAFIPALWVMLVEKWQQTLAGTSLIVAGAIWYALATWLERTRAN